MRLNYCDCNWALCYALFSFLCWYRVVFYSSFFFQFCFRAFISCFLFRIYQFHYEASYGSNESSDCGAIIVMTQLRHIAVLITVKKYSFQWTVWSNNLILSVAISKREWKINVVAVLFCELEPFARLIDLWPSLCRWYNSLFFKNR